MKKLTAANISIVTLGVENLKTATAFYEKLGWINTTASQESVSFLQGHSIVLGLFGRDDLAKDAGVENTSAGFRGVTLALNQKDEMSVDEFFAHAVSCGAKAIKQPEKVFLGRLFWLLR